VHYCSRRAHMASNLCALERAESFCRFLRSLAFVPGSVWQGVASRRVPGVYRGWCLSDVAGRVLVVGVCRACRCLSPSPAVGPLGLCRGVVRGCRSRGCVRVVSSSRCPSAWLMSVAGCVRSVVCVCSGVCRGPSVCIAGGGHVPSVVGVCRRRRRCVCPGRRPLCPGHWCVSRIAGDPAAAAQARRLIG
jgi:hypothetical protein